MVHCPGEHCGCLGVLTGISENLSYLGICGAKKEPSPGDLGKTGDAFNLPYRAGNDLISFLKFPLRIETTCVFKRRICVVEYLVNLRCAFAGLRRSGLHGG